MPPKKGNQGSSSGKVKDDKVWSALTGYQTRFYIHPETDVWFEKREPSSSLAFNAQILTTYGAIEKPIYESPETGGQYPETTRGGWQISSSS